MSKSSTITAEQLSNPHVGEILMEEFLEPLGLSEEELAVAINLPSDLIRQIIEGDHPITADTDLRLARYFGVSDGMFLALQAEHDLLARKRELGPELTAIRPHAA